MAVDAVALVEAVELVGFAVGLVGGACLLIPCALLAFREIRNLLAGGAPGSGAYSARQVAAMKAKAEAAAMEFEFDNEMAGLSAETEAAVRDAQRDAERTDDFNEEQAFRATLSESARAERAALFDDYGKRLGPEKGEIMPDGSVHGMPGYRL